MRLKLSTPVKHDWVLNVPKVLAPFTLVVPLFKFVMTGVALYYLPGFLIWLQSRSIKDGATSWNVGWLWLFLLAIAIPVAHQVYLRSRGRWGWYNHEDNGTHSFDFTYRKFDRRS